MSISDEISSLCSSRLTKDSSSIDETNRRRSIPTPKMTPTFLFRTKPPINTLYITEKVGHHF